MTITQCGKPSILNDKTSQYLSEFVSRYVYYDAEEKEFYNLALKDKIRVRNITVKEENDIKFCKQLQQQFLLLNLSH
jgi:hypothetical protein